MSLYILISLLSRQQSFSFPNATYYVCSSVLVVLLRSRNGTKTIFLCVSISSNSHQKRDDDHLQHWSSMGTTMRSRENSPAFVVVVIRGRWKLPPIRLQSWQTQSYRRHAVSLQSELIIVIRWWVPRLGGTILYWFLYNVRIQYTVWEKKKDIKECSFRGNVEMLTWGQLTLIPWRPKMNCRVCTWMYGIIMAYFSQSGIY